MSEPLILTVPETVGALYLVPWPSAHDDGIVAAVRSQLATWPEGRSRGIGEASLDHGLASIEVRPNPADDHPFEMLQLFGAEPDQLRQLAELPGLVVITVPGLPGGTALHEIGARALATAAAASAGTCVLDTFMPQLLTVDAAMASLPSQASDFTLTKWVLVPTSAGDRGMWLTTKGLGRFGLPELEVTAVPPQIVGPWTSILSGIASVLLREFTVATNPNLWPDGVPPFIEIDSALGVTVADIAAAYGHEPEGPAGHAAVRLVPAPSSDPTYDEFLAVSPPDDFGRSAAEFLVQVGEDLFGANEPEIVYTSRTDDMDQAMATAISCLDVARDRFLAGEFQHRTLLMVKWRLEIGDNSEFPWAFVTDWTAPDQLQASSASDADHDPSVRVGRPLVLPRSSVVDWAVWVDGKGTIEGNWTTAVIEGRPPPPIPGAPKRRWGRKAR